MEQFSPIRENPIRCNDITCPLIAVGNKTEKQIALIPIDSEAQRNASKKISLTPKYFGKNISDESDRSAENGTYKRF
jgi:hypothetical protein